MERPFSRKSIPFLLTNNDVSLFDAIPNRKKKTFRKLFQLSRSPLPSLCLLRRIDRLEEEETKAIPVERYLNRFEFVMFYGNRQFNDNVPRAHIRFHWPMMCL